MTIGYICGFETGDGSEILTLGAGVTVQSTTVRTGNYALKAVAASSTFTQSLSATQSVIRYYIQFSGSVLFAVLGRERSSTPANRLQLLTTAGPHFQVNDAAATLGLVAATGTLIPVIGQWYRVEVVLDLAAGGIVQVWVNGVLDINTTHTSNVSATPTIGYTCVGNAASNEVYFDDIRIDTGTLTPPGAGQIIARQGVAGTPTYDAWTKNGAATAALCWSDTPFSTATSCSNAVAAAAQTMLVAPFSSTQSGHGTQTVGTTDTINAAKTALIAKEASAGTPSIRRRVAAANTDTSFSATTSDKYFDDGIWTTTTANLDTLEAGCVHASGTILTTVEDVWVIVDYTPSGGGSGSGGGSIPLLGVG